MRFLEIRFFGREEEKLPISGNSILIPLISTPQILGVLLWDDLKASVVSTVGMGLLFVMTYLLGIRIAKTGRNKNA